MFTIMIVGLLALALAMVMFVMIRRFDERESNKERMSEHEKEFDSYVAKTRMSTPSSPAPAFIGAYVNKNSAMKSSKNDIHMN